MMGLSERVNASNAEFEKTLNIPLRQKIEYIRIQGIAEDLKIQREKSKQSPIMNPLQSPIIDPFGITYEQAEIAGNRHHPLHIKALRQKLTPIELKEKDILASIQCAIISRRWAEDGDLDPHWSQVSARAIAQLQQLGFRDNADVQRYLDHGEMPQP